MAISLCPSCGEKMIPFIGRPKSQILLVGEFPGKMEISMNMPWVGNAGDVLKKELERAGIDYRACRSGNLWQHEKPGGKKLNEVAQACFDHHYLEILKQMATVRAVFLMGSELAPLFTGHTVSKINGSRILSSMIPSNVEVVVASYNPAICLQESGVVGDFRYAVEQFAKLTKQIYKEMIHDR